jgi:hypothetical protein
VAARFAVTAAWSGTLWHDEQEPHVKRAAMKQEPDINAAQL